MTRSTICVALLLSGCISKPEPDPADPRTKYVLDPANRCSYSRIYVDKGSPPERWLNREGEVVLMSGEPDKMFLVYECANLDLTTFVKPKPAGEKREGE